LRRTVKISLQIVFVLLIYTYSANVFAQPAVDGAKALYARVDSFIAEDGNNVDSVFVDDVTGFTAGDTVLVYQNTGIEPKVSVLPDQTGEINSIYNTGKYAFFKIQEVITLANCVVLNNTLPYSTFNSGERGQLIKVPVYSKARFTSAFSFPSWDQSTGVGGVFPIIAHSKILLEDDISADGKGFKGAVPIAAYNGGCSGVNSHQDDFYLETDSDSSGLKGEGATQFGFNYLRGNGAVINAGGGGNGKYSGGGGGSNKGQGGRGGDESTSCPSYKDIGGRGGYTLSSIYENYDDRIFFGGGGGASTQNIPGGYTATPGGNGGGIIIILTDSLVGNGHTISANGTSVSGQATAGGGGGGAGGVLVVDAFNYVNSLTLEVTGGEGGDVSGSPNTTGPGGGGGGGMICLSNSTLPAGVSINFLGGSSGTVNGVGFHNASNGSPGGRVFDLVTPIRGFLINALPDNQTICEGMTPALISASKPKGGDGTYTYSWLVSTDQVSWSTAAGVNNQRTYQPPQLFDTTYYRRAVSDGQIVDTSFSITINVHPKLEQNLIIANDTVCYNVSPGNLTASNPMAGGLGPDPGQYSFQWIESNDNSSYANAVGTSDNFSYNAPKLIDTTYYRRIASSGACTDTSNYVTIDVLPAVANNLISADQVICNNQIPNQLTGPAPDGGLSTDKRYQWQLQVNSGAWSDIGTSRNYSPPALSNDIYSYQRIFYSGAQNECIDTSNAVSIESLPDIADNDILNSDSTICANLPSILISGTPASGGDDSYKYYWESRLEGFPTWNTFPVTTVNSPLSPGTLNNSNWFRRVIYSGADDVCSNISDSFFIEVLPEISSNTISTDQVICENTSAAELTGLTPQDGDGSTYIYQWQDSVFNTDNWNDISTSGDQKDYSPGILTDSVKYRRIVFSGPQNTCQSISNEVTVSVEPAISNNLLEVFDDSTCLGTQPAALDATDNPAGGNGVNSFNWEESIDNLSWSQAPGTFNLADYQPGNLSIPMYYRRIVNSGACRDTTDAVFIDTLSLPLLTNLTASYSSICDDLDFFLTLETDNGKKPYYITYSNGIDAGNIIDTMENDIDSIQVDIDERGIETFNYSVLSLMDNNGCEAPVSNLSDKTFSLDVFRAPRPAIIKPSEPFRVCGTQFSLIANPDMEVTLGTWLTDNSDLNIDNPGNSKVNMDYPYATFDSIAFKVYYEQQTPSCGSRSDSLEVQLFEQPEQPEILEGDSLILFIVDNFRLNGSEPSSGSAYWSNPTSNAELGPNENNSIVVTGLPVDEKVIVRYTAGNSVCNDLFDDILILRREVHIFDGISPTIEDGLNDNLVAEGLDAENLSFVFQVFSTNGMLVREITEKDVDNLGFERGLENNGLVLWDGKTKNENDFVPSGTYYYVLIVDYKGREFIDKGYVVVK